VLDKQREAMNRGATEYLQKPLSKEKLLRALREHAPHRFASLEPDLPR
jgi:FixJ family two-component response regulator